MLSVSIIIGKLFKRFKNYLGCKTFCTLKKKYYLYVSCYHCRCILDKSTATGHCNNVKSLSAYERILSLLYNNYVRTQVEFIYQIDQLSSRVRSIESSRDLNNFSLLRTDYERDLGALVIHLLSLFQCLDIFISQFLVNK